MSVKNYVVPVRPSAYTAAQF